MKDQAKGTPQLDTNKVLKHFGGHRRTATYFGVSVQSVYKWGATIPPIRAFQLEAGLSKKDFNNLKK